jgi:hypothetical protein
MAGLNIGGSDEHCRCRSEYSRHPQGYDGCTIAEEEAEEPA